MRDSAPENTRRPRKLRLWHLSTLVAGSAVFFAIARVPGALPILLFTTLGLGPPIGLSFVWDRHVKESVRSNPSTVNAFNQFCFWIFCIVIPIGFYWMVLGCGMLIIFE